MSTDAAPSSPVAVPDMAREHLADYLQLVLHAKDGNGDAAVLSRQLHNFRTASTYRKAEETLADVLPPISAADPGRWADDYTLRAEIEAWRGRMGYNMADVSDFPDEDGDKWEIVAGGSTRYEVREVPRFTVERTGGAGQVEAWAVTDNYEGGDAQDGDAAEALGYGSVEACNEEQARAVAAWLNENAPGPEGDVWIVVDTDCDDERVTDTGRHINVPAYDPTDEDNARRAATEGNREDYRENACGHPFAWNYAFTIEQRRDAEDFARAGFVVAVYDGGQAWAGIDGGGYDFIGAHWVPLYLGRHVGEYVRTSQGLRRVVA